MTIPIMIALGVLYVALSQLKFAQATDPSYRRRMARREEIRERHARNRRRRAKKAQRDSSEGTQDAASSCCA